MNDGELIKKTYTFYFDNYMFHLTKLQICSLLLKFFVRQHNVFYLTEKFFFHLSY